MMLRVGDYSITRKLTWMNMIVTASALTVAFAVFVAYELITCRESIVRTLSTQAQIVGFNSVSALAFNDPQSAEKTLRALRASPHVVLAGIYLPDGRPFAAYWQLQRKPPQPLPEIRKGQAEFHQFKGGRLLLVRPIVFRGARVGIVLIESDLRQIDTRVRQYGTVMIGVLLASLLAALWVSAAFQQGIAGPIVRLAETAQTVSHEKNYSLRTPASGSQGELYVLIESFNEMLAQIQMRDAALEKARADLERRVHERTAQLEHANKELEAFSYSVSHDLRAPLRQVSGFAKILEEESGARLDANGLRHLKWIQDGARHMGNLIDDLLKMGRISRQEMVERPADLNILLQDALRDLQPEMEGRKIEWRIGKLPTADCDAGLMKVAITNLVSNAVKYTRLREAAVIEIGQTLQDGESVIFIRDNGAGFDQKYAHKLFAIFQRLHRAEEFEGTGVGLATVQRIIQRHRGRIWAEGGVDKGATFFFTLHACRQRSDQAQMLTKA
jgi:signal transduction histidine kinase